MDPGLQLIANLFMIILLAGIIAAMALIAVQLMTLVNDRKADRIIEICVKVSRSVNIALRIIIIPICAILMEILSYTVSDSIFSILAGLLGFIVLLTSLTIGFSYGDWIHKRSSTQDKLN